MVLRATMTALVCACALACSSSNDEDLASPPQPSSSAAHSTAGTPNEGAADVVALAVAFISALERKDRAAVDALLTDDVTLELPFPASSPSVFRGRAETNAFIGGVFDGFSVVKFVSPQLTPSADGRTVFAEAPGDFVTAAGTPYRNRYIVRLDFRDGRVFSIKEYNNPLIILRDLAPPDAGG